MFHFKMPKLIIIYTRFVDVGSFIRNKDNQPLSIRLDPIVALTPYVLEVLIR